MTAFKPDRTLDCRSVMYPVEKPLFLVVLRSGLNAPGQVPAALMVASIACAMDQDVVVYCVRKGPT